MWNRPVTGTSGASAELLRPWLPPGWTVAVRRTAPDGLEGNLEVRSDGQVLLRHSLSRRCGGSTQGMCRRRSNGSSKGRPATVALCRALPQPPNAGAPARGGPSYADATGNIRLVLDRPGLFVEVRGSDKDPGSEPRPLKSLKGPTAGRVVRALCDLKPPYGVRELAAKASTPLGSVARVAGLLDREALVERGAAGRLERVRRPELIRRWTQDYGLQRSNGAGSYLAPRGLASVLDGLRRRTGYSITGSLAASRRAAVAPPRLATVYAENPEKLAKELGLLVADAGANVLLLSPYDPVVFERTWSEEGLVFSALSQVVADLLTSPGRGPSEGEELLRWMGEHVDGWRA